MPVAHGSEAIRPRSIARFFLFRLRGEEITSFKFTEEGQNDSCPARTREFSRGMDILTKTDKVDAWMLACYGALKQPKAWTPPSEEIRHLSALLKRRDLLVSYATRERNRLEKYRATHTPEAIIISAESMLTRLNDELAKIELMLKQHIEKHIFLKEDYELLTSIQSVGPQLGLNMLVILRSHVTCPQD